MSIGLMIESKIPARKGDFVPVATEESFQKYWQPGCVALHLRWVPLFQTGLPLQHEDITPVLDELVLLKQWLSSEMPAVVSQTVVSRIEEVMQALQKIQGDLQVEVYIG
jgi:hypothetical protein